MELSRRAMIRTTALLGGALALQGARALPVHAQSTSLTSHTAFQQAILDRATRSRATPFLAQFRALFQETALGCVIHDGQWVVPSGAYRHYLFARDSFWVLAALGNAQLSQIVVGRFAQDQRANETGQIATALLADGAKPHNRDRDEESTMMYVLHNLLLARMGIPPDQPSLEKARDWIVKHIVAGRYYTLGETRTGTAFAGTNQLGTYHYWADTFRPAGRAEAVPAVIMYNQGLLCVALRALAEMGIPIDQELQAQADTIYATTTNPQDRRSLPQREGSTIVDVSALVGEALSLYFWDTSLLGTGRVRATLSRLARASYPDGAFLGFKVISDFTGSYRPAREFSGSPSNTPGDYHNGGSWLLYDALALYAGGRHGIDNALDLFWQRLLSETRLVWSSHEYLSTHPARLGLTEAYRDGYGWNTFVLNLLPRPEEAP